MTQQLPDWLEAIVEPVARTLYACEKERSDRCDAVISAAKGKTVTVGMEPWEQCWQAFYSEARAALAEAAPKIVEHLAQWQSIESAPKDGRDMLLAKYGWTVSMGDLEPGSPEWRARLFDDMAPREFRLFWMTKGHWSSEWNNWNDGQEPCGLADPTHWMPLPADPPVCTVPPDGWACTRVPGHEGPCAAIRREVNRDE